MDGGAIIYSYACRLGASMTASVSRYCTFFMLDGFPGDRGPFTLRIIQ
jgi:hypothetical protein